MPRFEPKTFSFMLERMANRVVARTELTDLEDGGVIHPILAGVARALADQSFQQVNLQRIWDIDTATGEDLDDRGQDVQPTKISRLAASKATGDVVFSRTGTTGTVIIPIGTIVRVPGGGAEFETTAAGSILAGDTASASIAIQAVEAGIEGNVDASSISQMAAVTGIETVTNAAALSGGQTSESDPQYRARIKAFLRSLPRGTPDALKFAVLSTALDAFGRIVSAEVVELEGAELGIVYIYVDDGTGTIEVTADNIGTPEVVIASAIGGEERLFLDNKPVKLGFPVVIEKNSIPLTEGLDFTLNRATGQITLTAPLVVTDDVTAEYTWLEGLIEEAQKIVDGDAAARLAYPGYRAAGTQVFVLSPTVLQQIVAGGVIVEDSFVGESAAVVTEAKASINRYINSLTINGDVIFSELIAAVQAVQGVFDVTFITPTSNVIIGEGELARVLDANITLS